MSFISIDFWALQIAGEPLPAAGRLPIPNSESVGFLRITVAF
jgi:hypothetical protein